MAGTRAGTAARGAVSADPSGGQFGWHGAHQEGLPQIVLQRTDGQMFRERVGFLLICIIGAYCMMRILVELKSILEPFLWAVFLVMAWKPVVDGLEVRIELLLARVCVTRDRASHRDGDGSVGADFASEDAREEGELQAMIDHADPEDEEAAQEEERGVILGARTRLQPLKSRRGGYRELGAGRPGGGYHDDIDGSPSRLAGLTRSEWRRAAARGLAVLSATLGMLGLLCGFGMLILESARHMRDNWDIYKKGAENLTRDMQVLFKKVPEIIVRQYQDISVDMVKTAQDILYGLLGDFVNNVSSLFFGVLLTLLYTLFWLCSPVPMDSSIDIMFRKYIMFKTLACFGYGVGVGLLLAALSIDLASVFALTTFALNYVPEVGPFIAMLLPCPIILLDSRLERPMLVLLSAVLGQLALKFAFSNIIEVKLIESDKKLRMHPVMILLSVCVFGHLWGPTGMLLSVPLMALLKVSLFSELVPSSYRDPILIVLEGDRDAPKKHGLQPDRPGTGASHRGRTAGDCSGGGRRKGAWAPPGG